MKKALCSIITALMLMFSVYPAFAATYYAGTSIYVYLEAGDNNVQFSGSYHWAQSYPPIDSITVVNNNFSSNCNIKIDWYDSNNNIISTSNISSNGSNTVNGPAGNTHFAIYGSCSDSSTPSPQPWAYIASETDSQGNTLIFDAPAPPSSGGGSVDLSPVVDALQVIQGQLTDIKGQINTLTGGSGGVSNSDIVDAIQDQTDSIGDQISDMSDLISGKLTTIQGKLNDINSGVQNTYSYISTPRVSQPLATNLPTTTFDPTPPPVTEPYQQPYKYSRPAPQVPAFLDSPGPLPISPAPRVMEHDPAAEIDQPIQKDKTLTIDPVSKDVPRTPDPANIDTPITKDPVLKETPNTQDPVIRETPKSQDPVVRETPRATDNPIQAEQPKGRESPITPAPPLIPNPPK